MSRITIRLGAACRRLPFLAPAVGVMALGLVLCSQGLWIPAKAMLAQVLLERAFDRSLATGQPVKPWPWADTWPVARITFPRLHRSVIVLDGASGQALAFGPGHVAGTPDAGDRGTAVYAAHRDTHFALLGQVRRGDEIEVTRIDGRHVRFRMIAAQVVRWDASGLDPHAPGRALALATCWPLSAKTHGPLRYLVWATPSKPPEVEGLNPDDRTQLEAQAARRPLRWRGLQKARPIFPAPIVPIRIATPTVTCAVQVVMANIKAKLGGVLRTRDLESAALVARNLMTSANRTLAAVLTGCVNTTLDPLV